MKKAFKFLSVLILSLIFSQCGKEEILLTTDLINSIRAIDIDNSNSAADVQIVFSIDDPNQVKDIRIILIPTDGFSAFNSNKVKSLEDGQFHTIAVAGSDYKIQLPATLKDVNGADIQNEIEYKLTIALLINTNWLLSEISDAILLKNENILNGRYIGSWTDNIYTNFGISCELEFIAGKLRGDFFYSPGFSPCCGGEDDGSITIDLEGNIIKEFVYNQDLDSFMGGRCPGLYKGTGTLKGLSTLEISFEGNDCEGDHTGGRIILEKIE